MNLYNFEFKIYMGNKYLKVKMKNKNFKRFFEILVCDKWGNICVIGICREVYCMFCSDKRFV